MNGFNNEVRNLELHALPLLADIFYKLLWGKAPWKADVN
jgi:hypothetical protein